jgi:hypothetical protein
MESGPVLAGGSDGPREIIMRGPTLLPSLIAVALLAACGAGRDPHPRDVDEDVEVRAGDSVERTVYLDESWDEDSDYWTWDEHVRDLPYGFEYDTVEVEDGYDWLSVTYELWVAPWVDPGHYRFRVLYEFWPDDSWFRDSYWVHFHVDVEPDRLHGTSLVVSQEMPRAEEPVHVVNEISVR